LFIFLHNTPVKNTTRPAQACGRQGFKKVKDALKSVKNGLYALFEGKKEAA
jgi:hypothetical protein